MAQRSFWLLVAVLAITSTSMLNGQESEQSLRLRLIDELQSIESELSALRQQQTNSVIELQSLRQRSQDLSTRLESAQTRVAALQRESSELSVKVSQLQTELAALRIGFDDSERAWSDERRELQGQIEDLIRERDAESGAASRQRWIGRIEVAVAVAVVTAAAAGIRNLTR